MVPSPSRRALAAAALLAGLGAAVPAARAEDPRPDPVADAAVARARSRAFVRVEVTLRHDEGRAPSTLGVDHAGYVAQERPLELAGVALAPDRVLTQDPCVHPRFVASVAAVAGARRVEAAPVAFLADVDGVVWALAAPLEGVEPPAFDGARPPPYRGVYHGEEDGVWRTAVGRVLEDVQVDEEGVVRSAAWAPALVVDRAGTAVGVTLADQVPADGTGWKGSPLSWPSVSVEERGRLVDAARSRADASLLRVHLRLRSPKSDEASSRRHRFFSSSDDDADATERDVVGVVTGERRVLVLETLDPKTTARLESVEVHPAQGPPVRARFVSSFRDYGALLVEAEAPVGTPVALAGAPLRHRLGHLLLDAEVEMHGERRVVHASHARVRSLEKGWRRQWVPDLWGEVGGHFLFDRDGALVALAVRRRASGARARWRRDDDPVLLPAEHVAPLLADPQAHADPANVPAEAEREGRLAWLGVETQALDRELARANGVSHLTGDGSTGALVSYVYAGSPAQAAGLEPGAVLLRLHSPEKPAPLPVGGSDDGWYPAFFDAFDDEMEERFSEMMGGATPWPSAESPLNRTLTELGVGKPFVLEYAVGGEVRRAPMTVVEAPVHFEGAPTRKVDAIGATVRDLTFEVRRHFRLDAGFEGVIVSKVERGGRAAVAGLRRLDIVLRVNERPVADVAAFAAAVEGAGELRFAVKDRLKERIVKIAPSAEGR